MSRPGGKVAILGGGMAGLSTAWRLSEPGWRDRFDAITVYQRGWRLGGKAASSRGIHGRIEEHGLHIWLGSYENAFALLRECYSELDRATSDPTAPIADWDQALIPADNVGVADEFGSDWLIWLATFTSNDGLPGEPGATGREMTVVEFTRRALRLVCDFAESQRGATPAGLTLSTCPEPPPVTHWIDTVANAALAALLALTDPHVPQRTVAQLIEDALDAVRAALEYERRPDHKRSWLLLSMMTAVVRGIFADNLITDPRGFRAINDEDFTAWLLRHGAHRDVLDFALVRGVYDLVFGYREADPDQLSFGAGLAVFMTGLVLFGHKGAVFWKMTAGMGDVVIAPLYQALRRRGVEFEFFHRLDALHLDERRLAVDAITMGRQVRLTDGVSRYEPLTKVHGLPVFPNAPLAEQLAAEPSPGGGWHSLETHWSDHADAETRVLRRGVDFDHVVLAVSVGMLPVVAAELIDDRVEWQEMTSRIRTVATQAFQLWLRPDEPSLGWNEPGVTISAYLRPFETWASMPQTLWAEDWPEHDRPGTVAYFCGTLNATWPTAEVGASYARRYEERVRAAATDYVDRHLRPYFPAAVSDRGFNWRLLAGVNGERGRAAFDTQYLSVNVDPSDRYVQSAPGTDRYRLRPDESGYDNLVLAGDWTDSGLNAGCIEAAVLSGLEAANALLGRHRYHRIRGFYLP
ncbi:amine oxidase [Mycobacterium kyorinense]|uniref:Amine oxidase n=1 Tax=Mycobacterium kyorinense TaxID=487514 RepID=A0A1A2YRE0_9MYCO|nr:FAD-dependent oxidoreductase [Mycobacterium kyorinense]OBI40575.1 amine oxidase [Mycobacterium kyorinense]